MVSVDSFSHLGFAPFARKLLCLPFFSKKVSGGDDGIRTHDPLLAGQVLSQLSYTPILSSKFGIPNSKLLGFAVSPLLTFALAKISSA